MADSVIITPPIEGEGLQPIDEMIGRVAGFIGQPDDPDARTLALGALDDAVGEINLQGTYLMNLNELVITNPSSGDTFALPDDWGWPYGLARIVDPNQTASFRTKQFINWVPWDTFQVAQISRMLVNEIPQLASIKSSTRDRAAYVWPSFSSKTSTLTFYIPYLTRTQRLTASSQLYLTDETRTVLIAGGRAYLALHRYAQTPQIWEPLMKKFQDLLIKLRVAGDRDQQFDTFNAFTIDEPATWLPRTYIKFGTP